MELITIDGVHHILGKDFISKSNLLKDMPCGIVPIPFDDETIQYLLLSIFPSDGRKLLNIAKAADFLQMDEELNFVCQLVADSLKSKTENEIKKFLNLP
jgi:hypothetical protein